MNNFRHLIAATITGALIVALAFLYEKTQAVDLRERNDIAALLDTLRDIDNRWDIDILRERGELDPNRPEAPNRGATANKALASLAAVLPRAGSAALSEGLGELRKAVLEKADLVEKYRGESLRAKVALHLALTGAAELAAQPVEGRAAEARQKNLDQAVAQLVAAAQQYYWLGKAAPPGALEASASKVADIAAAMGDAAQAQAVAIGGAIEELLKHKPVEEELFGRIASLSSGPRLDRMSYALNRELESTLQEKELYRVYLLAYAAALLLVAVYTGVRLRSAKEDLEQRLAERTRELAQALRQSAQP